MNYNTTTLTPSATGDGTFDSSNPISRRHIPASTAATTYATYGAGFSGGMFGLGLYDWGGALLSDDGTKFWMVAKNKGTNSDEAHIYAWTLSTPFRVDTAAAVGSTAIKVITEMSNITALLFNNDGTKIVCANGNNFYQFDLSTAYDLSTMGSGTESNWRIDLQRDPQYIDWSGDGDKLIVTEAWTSGGYSTRVRVFDLNTPYDITTMANLPVGTTTSFDANNPYYSIYSSNIYQKGWKISQDGLKFYAIDSANGKTLTKELPSPWVMRTGTVTTGDQYGLGDGNNWLTAAEDDYDLITGNYYKPQWTQNGSAIIIFNGTVAPNYLDIIPLPATQVFSSTDVGKKVVGNSGSAVITATSGTYKSVTAFADTSAISSWQLFGAEGKSDGSGIKLSGYSVQSDIVFPTGASGSGASMVYNNNVSPADSTLNSLKNVVLNSTGTIALTLVGSQIQRWNLSTAFDLSTMTEDAPNNNTNQMTTNMTGFAVKPDGTRFWVSDYNQDLIKQFTMSTAWSPSTASYDGYYMLNNGGAWNNFSGGGGAPSSSNFNPFSFQFNSDGTKMITIMWDNNPYHSVVEFTLSTGWDMSTMSYTSFANFDGNSDPEAIAISPDGLKLMMHGSGLGDGGIEVYSLPSAFSVGNSGNSLTKTSGAIDLSTLTGNSNNNITNGGLSISNDGKRMWVIYNNNSGSNPIYEITGGTTTVHPYSTYFPSLTTTGGQINSSYWVDLDSMVADETKNGGDVFYAVSTDDRTSWGVIKDGEGERKIVKNNSGTWQYNNDAGTSTVIGYDLSSSASLNKTLSYNSQEAQGTAMAFNNNGTKLYLIGEQNNLIHEYTLSTAYDISTSSYNSVTFNPSVLTPLDIKWKPDGTKLYVMDYDSSVRGTIYTFNVSTPWDITTASSASETFRGNAQDNSFIKFAFKTDGTMLFKLGRQGNRVHAYNLSTAWDVSSATYASAELPMANVVANSTVGTSMNGLAFNSSGTKLFVAVYHSSNTSNNRIYEIDLSTAWDIGIDNNGNGNYAGVYLNTDRVINVLFNGNGSQVYAMNNTTDTILTYSSTGGTSTAYGTSETWVDGTNNNEHATLQEALGAQSFNRMDKAQLQAVTDPNHYVLGDTLDLMIAPYATSGTSPLSDGVTIGYQADALIKQAINGTDYEAEFPATNKVKIKSLAAQNLKIRII